MFSLMEPERRLISCGTTAILSLISGRVNLSYTTPLYEIVPESGSYNLGSMFISVLLPLPVVPVMATNSPFLMRKLMSLSITLEPREKVIPSTSAGGLNGFLISPDTASSSLPSIIVSIRSIPALAFSEKTINLPRKLTGNVIVLKMFTAAARFPIWLPVNSEV